MKIKTSEAAKNLLIHPSHLLLHIAELAPSLTFEDVWPEIDQAWVETISVSGGHRRYEDGSISDDLNKQNPYHLLDLSEKAIVVIDKLRRQSKWGDVSVSLDALVKLTHLSSHDIQEATAELRRKNLLDHDGTGRSTISLSSARRKEIESIARQYN